MLAEIVRIILPRFPEAAAEITTDPTGVNTNVPTFAVNTTRTFFLPEATREETAGSGVTSVVMDPESVCPKPLSAEAVPLKDATAGPGFGPTVASSIEVTSRNTSPTEGPEIRVTVIVT